MRGGVNPPRVAFFALLALSCQRPETPVAHAPDARTAVVQDASRDVSPAPPVALRAAVAVLPNSQPRWRYLAGGARPGGSVRWSLPLSPRNASGEPCTDGRNVYVAAVKEGDSGDGEVYAIDLATGEVFWHVPVGGIHGEPLELWQNTVLVDTIAHCARHATDSGGAPIERCAETHPGGVVALDVRTGRERFHSSAQTDSLSARWTAALTSRGAWAHDGANALRLLTPSATDGGVLGAPGARLSLGASALTVSALDDDLLAALDGRITRLARFTPSRTTPVWTRPVPYRGRCAPVVVGPVMVLPAFEAPNVSGAPRGFTVADGHDLWSADTAVARVHSCGAAQGSRFWQAIDMSLTAREIADGRPRANFTLPTAPNADLGVLVDGVFYLSFNNRISGFDTIDGHVAVTVATDAEAAVGLVVWGGRAAVATRNPGVVIGFD